MTTNTVVADDRIVRTKPTDEQIATYTRRERELKERFLKGVRNAQGVLSGLQILIERDFEGLVDMEELSIQIPALPRPTLEELKAKYPEIRSIERDTSPTEAVTLNLATVLRANEPSINGSVYEERLAPHHPVLLGYQQRKWALEHQHEYPALMALLGQIYVDFPGLVVVRGDGYRSYPCAAAVGGRWAEYWRWFRHGFDRGGRVAVSGPDVPVGAGK